MKPAARFAPQPLSFFLDRSAQPVDFLSGQRFSRFLGHLLSCDGLFNHPTKSSNADRRFSMSAIRNRI